MSDEDVETEQVLRDIYYSPTHGFRSAENVFQQAKKQLPDLTRKQVADFLKAQKTYTKFKSHKGVKTFLPTWVKDFDQIQVDLVDFTNAKEIQAKDNDGYNYTLTAIEILSRFAFTEKVKTKHADNVVAALASVFKKFKAKFEMRPKIIQFDGGREFSNKSVQEFLKKKKTQVWISTTKRKAAVVERFNRTLKGKMTKYFEHQGRKRWVDVLPQLTENYNTQKNSSIGMPPDDISEQNKHQVWMRLYGKAQGPIPKPKFQVGDNVRVLNYLIHYRDVEKWKEEALHDYDADKELRRTRTGRAADRGSIKFQGKHSSRFSEEVFVISQVRLGHPVTYKLYSDQINDEIVGIFYERELSEYTGGGKY